MTPEKRDSSKYFVEDGDYDVEDSGWEAADSGVEDEDHDHGDGFLSSSRSCSPSSSFCPRGRAGMESGGNSSIGLKKNGKKIDRTRRSWTPVGELVLVDLIKELLTKQWRTKNGFKPGRLLKLESGMMRKILGTDIRDTPHIAFRIAIWKKFQRSLQTMMCGNSGIGFNSSTSVIDYHNDAWASIVKVC
ncbi:hypothetical protein ACS0TY_006706 [Phlomoides rotata]